MIVLPWTNCFIRSSTITKKNIVIFTYSELESTEASTSRPKFTPDSSDEDERPSMPAESETAGIRRKGQGMRTASLGGNVGNWEKHTKGIGAKLLLQVSAFPHVTEHADLDPKVSMIRSPILKIVKIKFLSCSDLVPT